MRRIIVAIVTVVCLAAPTIDGNGALAKRFRIGDCDAVTFDELSGSADRYVGQCVLMSDLKLLELRRIKQDFYAVGLYEPSSDLRSPVKDDELLDDGYLAIYMTDGELARWAQRYARNEDFTVCLVVFVVRIQSGALLANVDIVAACDAKTGKIVELRQTRKSLIDLEEPPQPARHS